MGMKFTRGSGYVKLNREKTDRHRLQVPVFYEKRKVMSLEKVQIYLKQYGLEDKILLFEESSATVELAARALSCEPARIAKTLSFHGTDGPILIVAAGDAKIDNKKFKEQFGYKARMLSFEEVEPLVGHAVGGVCPFGVNENVAVYLDVSMKRFETVYPAAGSGNSAIEMTMEQLEACAKSKAWVDVCKGWNEA